MGSIPLWYLKAVFQFLYSPGSPPLSCEEREPCVLVGALTLGIMKSGWGLGQAFVVPAVLPQQYQQAPDLGTLGSEVIKY